MKTLFTQKKHSRVKNIKTGFGAYTTHIRIS